MPMIVDPDAPLLTPPTTITSADGFLTAVIDAFFAGVLLIVDRSADAIEAPYWSIVRVNPDGTRHKVRSADPVWSPGGYGLAYDHEAPLGVAVLYEATPILPVGLPTSSVSVTIPAPTMPKDVWIKSLDNPGRSVRVHVETWPELSNEPRRQLAVIPGSPYPVAATDTYSAPTSAMSLWTEMADDAAALRTLLVAADVLLVSTRPEYGRADQFVVPGEITESVVGPPSEPTRRWTVPLQAVARPDTAYQPMRMPGWSSAELLMRFASYAAAQASYATNADLATDGMA